MMYITLPVYNYKSIIYQINTREDIEYIHNHNKLQCIILQVGFRPRSWYIYSIPPCYQYADEIETMIIILAGLTR